MHENYDAIIIGAGVIGAAIAYELSKKGCRTLSIDKLPAAGYGPTSNSCAIIRVHYSTLEGAVFAYEGYFYWKNWREYLGIEDESGMAVFHETGCMVMKTEVNGYLERIREVADRFHIPYEEWRPEEIIERLPIYDMQRFGPPKRPGDAGFCEPTGGGVEGAVFFPTAGYISDPQLATHNLQRAAEARGAQFLFNKRVVEIPRANGRVTGVVLDDGTRIDAPVVVNVAGPYSGPVNRMAGADGDMNIRTRALRQEVTHVPSPEGFNFETSGFVVSDSDIGVYCRPETGNHILIGSEDPECDEREWVDPDSYDREFTEQWTTQAYRMAQRIPSLGIPSRMRGCVDLYDVSDDWIPIYDKSCVGGFYMAIGTSGNQFKNAPVAGAMMASLIEYCEGGGDHDQSPLAFPLRYVGGSIDVGFYSRRREINPNSSFSVIG
ncbi:MAG: FAD-dependent oxidoreductase [Gammaproteobacteria bacterium]|nr:FAD-dependent oxidoreductase [Gammaproteobacteria bacterium]NIO23681.1 FAD-dependent oxidoreductase [Gammaproteobacteria bacterium]NIO64297.1 FAD-dependent oxidoreductase [Gammaproteobacteria bacterium]NIP46180.1 FAD-binding oxidoreductase [Gammaproteobacteria bacterium]NIP63179.1 FAD-dependent oxidoreductase [Gammaproteobacteria bacterium]